MSGQVLVVGSGIAGLFTALRCARASDADVTIVTKAALEESNTRYAQGGIAGAIFPDDSPAAHAADTLAAGAGLCDPVAVDVLCAEAPGRIGDLLTYGVDFDRDAVGELARGREGAHGIARVLHAGGDATGARIESALCAAVEAAGLRVHEHTTISDLIVDDGRVRGARLAGGSTLAADHVVLASGGAGQVYLHTTNPEIATGDGVVAALRAGALVADCEFFQFHPTALALPGVPTFLVSEAVRGEGGVLRDKDGRRFVDELAARDVVARAITRQMAAQGGEPVVLDVTALDRAFLAGRFPRIVAYCADHGLDIATTPIPVTPAAHYWMGGVLTDLWGATSVPGLSAVGECANTGVHGANRLASNSLLEGIVFGARTADRIAAELRVGVPGPAPSWPADEVLGTPVNGVAGGASEIGHLMWRYAGLERDGAGLSRAVAALDRMEESPLGWVARLIATAALLREESRGAHYRTDYPDPSPECAKRIVIQGKAA